MSGFQQIHAPTSVALRHAGVQEAHYLRALGQAQRSGIESMCAVGVSYLAPDAVVLLCAAVMCPPATSGQTVWQLLGEESVCHAVLRGGACEAALLAELLGDPVTMCLAPVH